jgi:hypothetical protein
MLLQELIKQVGSKGLEGALHANKYKGKWIGINEIGFLTD